MANKLDAPGKPQSGTKGEGGGFLQRLFNIFLGGGDPDAERKKQLRLLGKDLTHSRFKFYRPKSFEALPGLARFFYEVYKTVAPAQVSLNNAASSGVLKAFVIESFLGAEQKAILERLTEPYIMEQSKTKATKDLQEQVKHDMINFFAAIDAERSTQIDGAYNVLLTFINFTNFDFYFLLKKFDANITERSFAYNPRFEPISADYIADDMADFLEVFMSLNLEADWKRIFGALKEYRNIDVIQIDTWQKLIPALAEVRKGQILEQVVRHVKQDPYMLFSPRLANERIVEPYIDKIKNQTTMLIQKISQERRSSKIEELSKAVFGTSVILRMKNYTEKANLVYAKKMLGGYIQTAALNYLKAYLMDYFKKDIRELVDVLLIRGQWGTNIQSQQLSDSYHVMLDMSDQIIRFDDNLADDGDMGSRLRNAVNKADRDKDAGKYLRQLLKDTNDMATAIVNKSAVNLITIGRHLRGMIDDLSKPHHEMILNWREIENVSGKPMKEHLTQIYKKIYYMVQLLQYYVKEDKE
ncbi:MAG: hypothetical protein A2087_08780 [Spirochaetes bacterium GWD1_61_31]|nr:MAG: hypothetical protein A2Y37_14465 [Spirochaetes bacterium GWB1_60_80]OHD32381.1 MAG: hypothetical protein A2004_06415 [Spirochaetes bacterium GWC1_61_12]OHD38062.1 MAG: hypothetical protein A2087_08780 [Spirochaetes bacterium GWD1_61_31]OHD44548.1 MAG: hypothetical protein A2Y35_05305 [Spirochaetes bacterium GWE1_60_18]OHD58664.1 MAG: hypothetical protein A2Y32_03310 [Spirochaetes bacterium GWF1_60_12]HAP43205.1 hypothetical protein [Spirochaetaceae bacterium]